MKSRIEISRSRSKVLIVPYHGNDYDRAIADTERHFNVVDAASMTVIALPYGSEIKTKLNSIGG